MEELIVDKEQTFMIKVDNEVVIEYEDNDLGKKVTDTKVKCEECGETMHKKSLSRHKSRHHLSSKLKCQYCNIVVSTLKNLEVHVEKMNL